MRTGTSSYTEVGDDFNPEVGFLERPDGYRQVDRRLRSSTSVRRTRRARASASGEPHVSYESFWGFDGLQETATLHIDSRMGLRERLLRSVPR